MVGGVYMFGFFDVVIMVCGCLCVFFVGLLFLMVVIGEVVIEEELGGVEMYMGVLGLGEYLVEDDWEVLGIVW